MSAVKLLLFVLLAGALAGGGWYGYHRYTHRFVGTDADLIRLLPPGDVTTFYMNVAALRQGGLLHLFTGFQPTSDKEYSDFVHATNFDYARDMDALAGASDHSQLYFLIRGKFDWDKLKQFATAHSGICHEESCQVPGSKPHRVINFVRIQPDTIGLTIGENPTAADLLRPPGRRLQGIPPGDPVWISLSQALLKDPTLLPAPMRIFAISLQPAESVIISAGQPEHSNEAFTLQLEAAFPNVPSADTTCKQLRIQTRMLQMELARENHTPNPADLSGLLTAGTFQTGSTRVFGTWPVRKELLNALE